MSRGPPPPQARSHQNHEHHLLPPGARPPGDAPPLPRLRGGQAGGRLTGSRRRRGPRSADRGAKTGDHNWGTETAARKQANALPEVSAAHQQAKADRALAQKARADYRTANKRATESEEAYRKAFAEGLGKVDPEAAGLLEKEKAAFRERMVKAREARKAAAPRKQAAREEPDQPDDEEEG